MSLFGSAILERLHTDSPASNPDNEFYKVFDNSVGEWLDNFDVDKFHTELFLNEADSKWLELHGEEYGVARHLDEGDDDFRERIIKHTLGELTPRLLNVDFGLELYIDTDGFSPTGRVLTSDNPYIKGEYVVISDKETKSLVERSFVLNEAIEWFVV